MSSTTLWCPDKYVADLAPEGTGQQDQGTCREQSLVMGPGFCLVIAYVTALLCLGGGEGTLQSYELDSLTKGNGDSLRQTEIQKRVIVTEIRVYEWP